MNAIASTAAMTDTVVLYTRDKILRPRSAVCGQFASLCVLVCSCCDSVCVCDSRGGEGRSVHFAREPPHSELKLIVSPLLAA